MFLIKKCFKKVSLFNTLGKLIFLLFFSILFSNNVDAQCNPPDDIPFGIVEVDDMIPQLFFTPDGIPFQHNLLLNLPLCPVNAAGATGCTQVQFDTPTTPLSDLGFSSYQEYYFWEDIWNNQINGVTGLPISEDTDGDGCGFDVLGPCMGFPGRQSPQEPPRLPGTGAEPPPAYSSQARLRRGYRSSPKGTQAA